MANKFMPGKAAKLAGVALHSGDNAAVWVLRSTSVENSYGDETAMEASPLERNADFHGWVGRLISPDKFGDDSRLKNKEVRTLWFPLGTELAQDAKLVVVPVSGYGDQTGSAVWYEVVGVDESFGLAVDGSVLIARNQSGGSVTV